MRVVRHTSWEELAALREPWDELLRKSTSDTIFLTWEWLTAWWKNYGAARPLMVLTAWEDDTLVGAAPFYIDRVRHLGLRWACLKFVGDGSQDSDYLDCFAVPGREDQIMSAFFDYLNAHREEWDELDLHGPVANSRSLSAFHRCARENRWEVSEEPVPCATLPLPRRWEDYLSLLKPRFRTKVRSSLAFLQEQFKTSPEECLQAQQLDQWLPMLFDLHTKRWKTAGLPGVFRGVAKRNFYHDVSRLMLKRGWLALHRLDWGEHTLAIQYGFVYKNRFHLLQEGFDPSFENIRPGVALRSWLMRHWIERGLQEYDFLAGTAGYKFDWGAQKKMSVRVRVTHSRRWAWIITAVPRLSERTKELLRPVIPQSLLSMRKNWRSMRAQERLNTEEQPSERGFKQLGKKLASRIYSSTPAGALGRRFAATYQRDPSSQGRLPTFRRRLDPVLHILIYHRINDDRDPYLPSLAVETFHAQMEYLSRNFPVVGLDEFARGELPRNGKKHFVAITFDDGYRDNFTNAFPILKKLGIPAQIFLTTGCIEKATLPWYDQVCLAFKLTARSHLDPAVTGGAGGSLGTPAARLETLQRTLGLFWTLPEPERLQRTSDLFYALNAPSNLNLPNIMLNWDEIRQMRKDNIRFGAHTVTHPALSRVSGSRLDEEIRGSKRTIEDRLQAPVRHFAYPFGRKIDYSAEAKEVVRQAGFETAVTTIWGFNSPEEDRYELRRFSLWETDPASFAMKLDLYRVFGLPQDTRHESSLES